MNIFNKIWRAYTAHKVIGSIIAIVGVYGGYAIISKYTGASTETRYIVANVERGTIVTSVTGSGQVSASNQVELKSKSSGPVLSIPVKTGQAVKAGDVIAQVDARDAAIALENARISYQKLTQSADTATLVSSENALSDTKESHVKAIDALSASYSAGVKAVGDTFIDFPSVIDGMNTLFYQNSGLLNDFGGLSFTNDQRALRDSAGIRLDQAKTAFTANLNHYKTLNINNLSTDASTSIEAIIDETTATAQLLTQAVKDAKSTLDIIKNQTVNPNANFTTAQNNLNSWLTKVNTNLSSLINIQSDITNAKTSINSTARDIVAKTESLTKLTNGADPLDIQSERLNLQQKQNAYDDSFIRAPFDGVVAKINVKLTDDISNGTSVATFITQQQQAVISLNEVDVAKIKMGDKATLTFDAVDGLTITGIVSEIDLVGTVSQGVVSYNVTITFDTQDDRVKSGMSVSAAIVTDVHPDVLVVANSAIKSQGSNQYVEVFSPTLTETGTSSSAGIPSKIAPIQKMITTGISDDMQTEVISGLNEGDQVVTKTITATAQTTTAPSIFSAAGVRTGGTGAARTGTTGR